MFVEKKTIISVNLLMMSMCTFKYLDGAVEMFSLNGQFDVKANNLLTTFNIFPKEYEITFEVYLSSFTSGNNYCMCANLFRFTSGNDDLNINERLLAAWFTTSGTLTFYLFINSHSVQVLNVPFSIGWKKFNISQLLLHGAYISTIQVDGVNISSVTNTDAEEFYNVKLYFSDPWYLAQPGMVRNLLVTKGCSESNFYCKPLLEVTYDADIFLKLGCWKDTQNRALTLLEDQLSDRTLSYKQRPDPLGYCYRTASKYGYLIFSLQYGGQCFAGNNTSYQNFGKSDNCNLDGRGGRWANEVYTKKNSGFLVQNAEKNIYVLDISFNLDYINLIESAFNATWEYFIPPFINVNYEDLSVDIVKINSRKYKYKIFNLKHNGVNQSIIATLNNTRCLFGGTYKVIVPIKIYFENTIGNSWETFKTVSINIQENCPKTDDSNHVLPTDPNHVPEYYARGIYWNDANFQLYLCMNQYVTSMQKPACFSSESNGVFWKAIDIRVGAVLGHHILSRELYVVHRNQKSYLKFSITYKKWLAVTNHEFEFNISKNINWTCLKTLEGNYDQVILFGTNQWKGNASGLYIQKLGENIWIQRAKWSV
ncbi:uncharacterized protein LOC124811205 isoform X2 [Hydra vulgaris]|uniref:Uncharacterized protein LOC124811205 isoform X2 n=1 Tax=Hydra vulgaris TaxID=6087 RepID=A0ABM4CL08_HYDVU